MLTTFQLILFIILPAYVLVFSAGYVIARWNRGHTIMTLGLGPRILPATIATPVDGFRMLRGLLVSLVLFPVLAVIGLLSIPIIMIVGLIQGHREADFAERMRHLGRAISWAEAERHAVAKEGTLICEILWLNGGSRLWWTPEIVANLTQFPYVRSGDKNRICFEEEFQAFNKWCFEHYTGPLSGRAVLVEIPKGGRRRFWRQINEAGFEYAITHYRDKTKGREATDGEEDH